MQGNTIELFNDVGMTEDEINKKYPETNTTSFKVTNWLKEHPILVSIVFISLLFLIFDYPFVPPKFKQSGGNPENGDAMGGIGTGGGNTWKKVTSPVSSTFSLVTTFLGKFLKLLLLLVMIVMVPTVPIVLYCLVAYYIIKKFLFMFTRIK